MGDSREGKSEFRPGQPRFRSVLEKTHPPCCKGGLQPFFFPFLLYVMGLFGLVLFASASASDPGAAREIPGLVKQLGSEVFKEREAATLRLKEIGEPALDALHQAA